MSERQEMARTRAGPAGAFDADGFMLSDGMPLTLFCFLSLALPLIGTVKSAASTPSAVSIICRAQGGHRHTHTQEKERARTSFKSGKRSVTSESGC